VWNVYSLEFVKAHTPWGCYVYRRSSQSRWLLAIVYLSMHPDISTPSRGALRWANSGVTFHDLGGNVCNGGDCQYADK
jgi:hypothetical protein